MKRCAVNRRISRVTGMISIVLVAVFGASSCSAQKSARAGLPDWAGRATVYEVNVRQYTHEGTFRALEAHLPRLKELGVDILWIMPVYPISQEKRLGSLGSYYAVSDYRGINPEFGTIDDFRHFVQAAHAQGFKVVLDWVANHTGWDHPWVKSHPDWFTRDAAGKIVSPETWTDVADLDYEKPKMRKEMIDSMKYWVKEFDIDGFRCDYAGGVPASFWEEARSKLQKIKPVFMLAEDEHSRALVMKAFDANYGWELYRDLNSVARGSKKAKSLESWFHRLDTDWPEGSYPLLFIDNHDENSWTGTVQERLGDARFASLALVFTAPGIPLVYSGQEAGLNKRLAFFDKDEIPWNPAPEAELIRKLTALRHENPALWCSPGATFERIDSGNDNVLCFRRSRGDRSFFGIFNLSAQNRRTSFKVSEPCSGIDAVSGKTVKISSGRNEIALAPWEFILLSK